MTRAVWAGSLSVVLGLVGVRAHAQDATWRPATARPPAASLDRPVPRGAATVPARDPNVSPVSHSASAPAAVPSVVRAQGVEPAVGPPPVPPPGTVAPPLAEPYNSGVVSDGPPASPFGFGPCLERGWFRSDHCFDQFASPVTNPFLFEDPRALTEVRPIFIYQSTPDSNRIFRGGDIEFFGLQARLAVTERLSFVIHKLGWVWIEPHNPRAGFEAHTGFAEVWLGPKYTFLRSENTDTVGAVGLQFQVPTGPRKVFQHTGDLSLVPYLSLGQSFWRSSYGSFNALGTVGYAFATDDQRTDYFFLSAHLDYDIANLHKIYPFVELNWFTYTKDSNASGVRFEGRDLFNLGAGDVSSRSNLSLATGLRYKFSECVQAGLGTEWSVIGRRDLLDFRLTADLIFRY